MASKVYFSDLHVHIGDSLLKKFDRMIIKAGIDQIDFTDKFVAVKIHFGEYGNMAFLRHQYAKVLCDHIKARGGKPFLTDCNTLYVGYRNNALNHLESAYMNGYNPLSTGVHTIIADGLRGTDEREIPVVNGEYVEKAKIGAAIAEADIVISLTHCKGHVSAGFGGTMKNIGMGSGSKRGKMEMHFSGTPLIDHDLCIGCGQCVKNCNNQGVNVVEGPEGRKAYIDEDKCLGCGYCFAYCPKGAISPKWGENKKLLNYKIAEYTKAALQDKPSFHISLLINVSPECDCEGGNDLPVIPDVGMFASFDPVAIDQAAFDMANQQPVMPGSMAEKHGEAEAEKHDVFKMTHPDTDFESALSHGEKIGLGTREYELIKV